MAHHFIQLIFALTGTVSLLAAVLDWDWFFTAQNTQFVVNRVGRRRARWLYGTLGVVLVACAVYFFRQTSPTLKG